MNISVYISSRNYMRILTFKMFFIGFRVTDRRPPLQAKPFYENKNSFCIQGMSSLKQLVLFYLKVAKSTKRFHHFTVFNEKSKNINCYDKY